MCDYNKNAISHPELSAEKGWTELVIPDSYGKGQAFIDYSGQSVQRIRSKVYNRNGG